MLATAQLVDIETIFATATEVVAVVAPGATLQPPEPIGFELSAQALAVTVTSPEGTDVFLVDALAGDAGGFDPASALEAMLGALGESLDIGVEAAAEAGDLAAFQAGNTFRSTVVNGEDVTGEFRFSMAAQVGETPAETAAAPPATEAPAQAEQAAPAAVPDLSQLASRLPNLAAVDMDVTVELGRVRLPIKELLALGSGSVVRLGTPIGESFDILVNGKAAARGDLVVVGGKLAVRIRELLGIQS